MQAEQNPGIVRRAFDDRRLAKPAGDRAGNRPDVAVRYSFVIPVFNEIAVLPQLISKLDELTLSLDGVAEVIFVDDGSRDGSADLIAAAAYRRPEYRLLELSRNFGHQAAITAGMDHASGDAIIIMDADLQDPPDLIPKLIDKWAEGYDIVYAQRAVREAESRFKRATAWLYYRLIGLLTPVEIPRDVGDFRLVDRAVIDSFLTMHERDRFVRGMFAWMGYRQIAVPFTRPARAAGETKYPFRKMLALAFNGIFSFSDAPLRFVVWLGMIISVCAALAGAYVTILGILRQGTASGWTSVMVFVGLLAGLNMLMTGIVGLYVARIHHEVKARPLYLVRSSFGFRSERTGERARRVSSL